MTKSGQGLLFAFGFVVVGAWLMSRPNCNKGCQSVAAHLLDHGLEDLFKLALSA